MSECPYCLNAVGTQDPMVVCPSCGAEYHSKCWFENRGCCAKDCKSTKSRLTLDIAPDRQQPIAISREDAEKALPHKPEPKWNPCLACGRHVRDGQLYCRDCTPEREESQDAKNAGPLLLTLLVVALVIAAVVILGRISEETPHGDARPQVETTLKK